MTEKPYQNKDKVLEKLQEHDYNVPSVAEAFDVSKPTMYRWLENHDIEYQLYKNKEKLEELYVERGLNAKEVGEKLYCSEHAVLDWLHNYDLPVRTPSIDAPPTFRTHQGYEYWEIVIDDTQHSVAVHRLLAVAEYGYDKVKNKDVHHKNGVKWDNRAKNIELKTTEEHMRDHINEWERDEKGRILPHQ